MRLFILFSLLFISCNSENKKQQAQNIIDLQDFCEGCEAIYEYGKKQLTEIDTLPKFNESKFKIKLTGTVFRADGKTLASGVILYIYQTNEKGIYETLGNEKGWAKRHGYIRGWIKTNEKGEYTFYTFRPAAYSNRRAPEHIHLTVKEPNRKEYYLDDFLFDDDPLLTINERKRFTNRGGSGILKLQFQNGIQVGKRDIILGKNIPNYE